MPRKERRETPVVFQDWSTVHELQRPFSPLQALMEARPAVDPLDSVVGLQPLREAVVDCLDALCDRDRVLLEATHIERITVRELAERCGLHKSYTYRLVKRAELRLRDECLIHPVVLTYLGITASIVPVPPAVDVSTAQAV
jgi:DNA-directed RNA polymerase specialized sigma24 family protein